MPLRAAIVLGATTLPLFVTVAARMEPPGGMHPCRAVEVVSIAPEASGRAPPVVPDALPVPGETMALPTPWYEVGCGDGNHVQGPDRTDIRLGALTLRHERLGRSMYGLFGSARTLVLAEPACGDGAVTMPREYGWASEPHATLEYVPGGMRIQWEDYRTWRWMIVRVVERTGAIRPDTYRSHTDPVVEARRRAALFRRWTVLARSAVVAFAVADALLLRSL